MTVAWPIARPGRQLDPTRTARGRAHVRIWLLAVAALVFLMVSVGGATRLTGSGLSITEWQPIIGVDAAASDADWQEAFAKYRQIPQYQHVNRGMSLEAFKAIFWWEWAHRFLGRADRHRVLCALPLFPRRRGTSAQSGAAACRALRARRPAGGRRLVHGALRSRRSHRCQPLPAGVHLALAILIFGALVWTALSTR